MGTRISSMPGKNTPVAAGTALAAALAGTNRWQVGTVTNTNTGGASMYDTDGWSGIVTLLDVWKGEIEQRIEVGTDGVINRYVDYFNQEGSQTALRRYDFGADLKSVKRIIEDGPLYCRLTPRGKGEETDEGGYGRKITIESVNDGKDYLVNDAMVDLAKLPDGQGGWEYPTLEVENSEIETPAALKTWAESVLDEYTNPKVSYEVDVLQLGVEGVDFTGVSLGDAVQIVDRKFNGVRITGRVVSMMRNMLDESDTQINIGYLDGGLADKFSNLENAISSIFNTVQVMNGGTMSTAEYLSRLLDRLNMEINATGGYTYITEGQGIRTYDIAVQDPTSGLEANSVVEIKGGTIRVANSKTAQGQWDWKTVIVSGHIAAEMITTAQITAGYIGSADSGNYWNLDTGVLRATFGTIGGFTIGSTALYNNRTSLTGSAAGVYVGINGVASGEGTYGIAMGDGVIAGYYGNNEVGRITANAEFTTDGTITRGIQLRGDVIDFRTDMLLIKHSNSTTGTSTVTIDSDQTINSILLSGSGTSSVTLTQSIKKNKYVAGFLTGATSNTGDAYTVPTKTYTDNQLSAKANSSDVTTALASKANRSELPTFTQTGSVLYITTP